MGVGHYLPVADGLLLLPESGDRCLLAHDRRLQPQPLDDRRADHIVALGNGLGNASRGRHRPDPPQRPCGQYACYAHTRILIPPGIHISMTEDSDPRDNGIAERVNGILKDEQGLEMKFESFEEAWEKVQEAIEFYNYERPQEYRLPLAGRGPQNERSDLKAVEMLASAQREAGCASVT